MCTKFPKPSGKYAVGCTDILPSAGPESIYFRLYYPNYDFTPSEDNLAYWAKEWEYIYGYSRFIDIPRLDWLLNRFLGNQKIPVHWEAPIISEEKGEHSFPVVVFSHGLGGNRTTNSYVCYELACHGFIVASLEHRDLTASVTRFLESPDKLGDKTEKQEWVYLLKADKDAPGTPVLRNMQVLKRSQECSKCLNHLHQLNGGVMCNIISKFDLSNFEGRLNLEQVVTMGHSFGGATAIVNSKQDPRFKAAVMLDAWMTPIDISLWNSIYGIEFTQPMLFINSEKFQTPHSTDCIKKLKVADSTMKKEVKMLGLVHRSFCDFCLILPHWAARLAGLTGNTDAVLGYKVTMEVILKFIGNAFDLPCKGNVESLSDEYDFVINESTNN